MQTRFGKGALADRCSGTTRDGRTVRVSPFTENKSEVKSGQGRSGQVRDEISNKLRDVLNDGF